MTNVVQSLTMLLLAYSSLAAWTRIRLLRRDIEQHSRRIEHIEQELWR